MQANKTVAVAIAATETTDIGVVAKAEVGTEAVVFRVKLRQDKIHCGVYF